MKAPIRAVLLSGPLTVTATNLHTLDLTRELRSRGIEATVVAGDGPLTERFESAGIPVSEVELTGGIIEDFPHLRSLRQTVAGLEPHLIHVIDPALFRHGSALSHRTGTPLFVSLDALPRSPLTTRYGLLRGILVPTRGIRDEIALRGRAPQEQVHVVPPGIDISRFPLPGRPFAGGRPILSAVTPLPKAHGLSTLLEAVKLLRNRDSGVHLIIAGHGPGDQELRRTIREEGLARDVTVTGVPLDLERVFGATDIFLRAARPGGFGTGMLMAMASGRPIVAEGVGPALSIVREGETGYLVPAGDAEFMAKRIAELIEAPDRAAAFGAAGRKAAEQMKMAVPASLLERLYREAVSAPQLPAHPDGRPD